MITKNDLPIIPPVRVEIPAGTQRIISFPNEFFGSATSIIIINNDGANAITYRYGGEAQPLQSIPASSIRTIDGTIINLLEINSGAGGTTSVEAQVLLDPRANQATPETVV